jgi:D-serine deaminase-like pyridoxal phosphate-dependent protein
MEESMKSSRRSFLAGAAPAAALAAYATPAGAATPGAYPYAELEARIARRDFRDLTKDVLPTPSMIVDLDLFEANLKRMAEHTRQAGLQLRPHVKVHKSVDVAKRQMALGAIGLTTATIAESELMSGAGIQGVLWTKQPVSRNNIARAIALTKRDPTFMFVIDDPQVADWVEEAAAAAKVKCRIAVALFAGLTRQGIRNGEPAVRLAQRIASSKHMRLEGYMAYSGGASHTHGWEARRAKSADDLSGLQETLALSRKSGLPGEIVSGGSTGTYNIDKENALTELECGSYVFMDTAYMKIGSKSGSEEYSDWQRALTVLTTVDSKQHAGLATIDYGNKAMARPTDQVKGMPWLKIANQGAEYGLLTWSPNDHEELKIGDRVEIYCTNLDMSTNCYDRYYVARGDRIVDVWPIMNRAGAAQR